MKLHPGILAGTALGLLMATWPLAALPLGGKAGIPSAANGNPLILAQAECPEGEPAENCAQPSQQPTEERPAPEPEATPPPPEPEATPPPPAPEPTPEPEPAPQPAPPPPAPEPAPEPAPPPAPEPAPAPEPPRAPEPEPKPEPQVEKLAPEQPAPLAEEPAPQTEPAPEPKAPAEQPAPEPAPQPEQPPAPEPAAPEPQAEKPSPAPEAEKPAPEAPATEQPAPVPEPAPSQNNEAAPQENTGEKQPPAGEAPAKPATPPPAETETPPANPDEAPLLDSQKEAPPPAEGGKPAPDGAQPVPAPVPAPDGTTTGQPPAPQPAPVEVGPPPADDRAAQQAIAPEKIVPAIEEKGTRRERPPEPRRERPDGIDVLREIGDRVILQLGGQTVVESNDRPRMTRDARDVYYEDLPRGRTREVIIRDNGSQIVTIRNRYGDVLQRSRITPDGREYILSYAEEDRYDEMREWRDPGYDLPPIRLTIPRDDYILESRRVRDPDAYYRFLEQPPVERVQRLYSVEEVKRSARVRDIARRIDLDTLNFEFGSASIGDSEIEKLDGVATAIEKMLDKNPAETFLIEGHTDAVGSDQANLALSDRRAESVAEALTWAFGIPPENLATQGYGEQYLKIRTQKPERENRRVTIRRITPLVTPVAKAR